jgi:hypothetical protein
MKAARKTKWELDRTLQVAREALSLLEGRREALEPRLDPGAIEGLQNDIRALEALKSGRPAKAQEVQGLTGTKKDQARYGAEWVSAIREAVKRRAAGQGLRKSVGVGRNIHPTRETAVAGAIEGILALAKEQPQALRACGILDSDLDTGRALLAALGEVQAGQKNGLVDKKNLTDMKNATQARLEETVEAVATAAYLHYLASDRALAQRFRNLIPASPRASAKAGAKPADAPKA